MQKTFHIKTTSKLNHKDKDVLYEAGAMITKSSRFSGGEQVIEIIIATSALLTPVIGALTKVAIEAIRSKKHIEVKINGLKVKGVSEKSIKKIIENASKKTSLIQEKEDD